MLKEYCATKGISKEEVLVFGDGLNDSSMFVEFPHSICMANGDPRLKEMAEYISGSNSEDGFYQGVMHYLK